MRRLMRWWVRQDEVVLEQSIGIDEAMLARLRHGCMAENMGGSLENRSNYTTDHKGEEEHDSKMYCSLMYKDARTPGYLPSKTRNKRQEYALSMR